MGGTLSTEARFAPRQGASGAAQAAARTGLDDVTLPGASALHSGGGRSRLPAWPLWLLLAAFPAWWVLGVADLVWVPFAVIMAVKLAVARAWAVPRHFGVWVLFLLFMLGSVIEVSGFGSMIGFADRAAIYLSSTVILIYAYNARERVTKQSGAAILTSFWLGMSLIGLLDVIFPRFQFKTPAAFVLAHAAPGLLSNDLVSQMVVRHLSSYSPDTYFDVSARPSAPFVFANNWGNAYSLTLPVVVAYLITSRRRGALWWITMIAVPISGIPAVLTLNRGMYLGLGVALVYSCLRLALKGRPRAFLAIAAFGVLAYVLASLLPVSQGLAAKETASTTTRASLYSQAIHSVPSSPIFGHGVPISSTTPGDPPVGTQGQFWMLLVSHGPVATACFVGFFLVAIWRTRRIGDHLDLAYNAVTIVGVMELTYYGVVPYGLPLMMVIAGFGLRPWAARRPVPLERPS